MNELKSSTGNFQDRFNQVLNDNLSDCNFGIQELMRELGIGRSSLFSMVKNELGISPLEALKLRRLQVASELLKKVTGVSHVYARVGFKSVAHFSRAFKKQFGVSPSKYV
ncbi:helix-turn-helix domain-containing protein [Reichenbachiella versicolor]|uniref:helix-turn-helix domain-containing protein n=1 Tax=Reichenbachiella versicolor TaxID=1821036 RepID=UPI000D6DD4E8|nr:helix-turn-helix domain-containing protein [Reichenbachiella versicolor]